MEGGLEKGPVRRARADPFGRGRDRDVEGESEDGEQAETVERAVVRGDQHDGFVDADGDAEQGRAAFVRRLGEAITDRREFFPGNGFDVGGGPEPRSFPGRDRQPHPHLFRRQDRRKPRLQENAPGNGGVAIKPDDPAGVVGGELGHRLSGCRK
ncbi:hypothetical protein GCM10027598_63550 [Amycolatopsis oliviviridis]|uniref:Uncharacterized protein n=1 Tax=Amycolatopsis oliviviridis TaxID=1471590 RepID=A0ABQ3M7A5_9PSEU|nr:hypothetical protein GCM10017790_71850 [Amycolatopsis oliviviridis]